MIDRYPYFFEVTFLSEGYFQNIPEDKGNWYKGKLYGTICGVAAAYHFETYQKLKRLFDEKKYELLKDSAMRFYRKKGYWNDGFNEIADSSLAFKLFDLGVNMGRGTSIKLLQKTLNKHYDYVDVYPTGTLDTKTIERTNEAFLRPPNHKYKIEPIEGESQLYACYTYEAKKYYSSLKGFNKFGRSWLRRLKEIYNGVPDRVRLSIEARPPEKLKGLK